MAAAPTEKKTRLFIEGLKKYDLTIEQINAQGWKYCGGTYDAHLNYYNLMFKDETGKRPTLPEFKTHCICGHKIRRNCFICSADKSRLLVLGSCCIKKFIPKSGRSCEKCGESHINRKKNLCDTCQEGICRTCSKPTYNPAFRTCRDCAQW